MPKLQRFEGANAEEVRARVLDEVGPEVVIVHAGRERCGGVLGFFEKEMFVLEVALPDENGNFEQPATLEARPSQSIEEMVEQTEDIVNISRNGFVESFSSVLEEAEAALAMGESPEPMPTSTPAERSLPTLDRPEQPSTTKRVRAWNRRGSTGASINIAPPPVTSLKGRLERSTDANRRAKGPQPSDDAGLEDGPLDDLSLALHDCGLALDLLLAANGSRSAGTERLDARLLHIFSSIGLTAPSLPELTRGHALIVVGERGESRRLARQLAAQIGARDEAITPVSLRQRPSRAVGVLSGPLRAAQTVAQKRVEDEHIILAVEVGADPAALDSLRRLVTGTRPESIWAACPADFSADQCRELINATGKLDAIALYGLDEAERPAALIGCGVPIAYLDWRPATPLMWAARIFERLSAENVS